MAKEKKAKKVPFVRSIVQNQHKKNELSIMVGVMNFDADGKFVDVSDGAQIDIKIPLIPS